MNEDNAFPSRFAPCASHCVGLKYNKLISCYISALHVFEITLLPPVSSAERAGDSLFEI
jgi:hypothetical protein